MNVLSLFDGISCARVALDRAGIPVATYFASEVDTHAIKVSEANYPDIVRLGDVRNIRSLPVPIDLLIGGSPCQDLSIAKKERRGLEGDRSGLFWDYVRLLRDLNPKWFLLENVASMPKADRNIITREMGVVPVMFDASLVSAQSRKRLFWTNIPFELPVDQGIVLKDILLPDEDVEEGMKLKGKSFHPNTQSGQVGYIGEGTQYGQGGQAHRVYNPEGKTPTLSSYAPLIAMGRDIGRRLNAEGHREDSNKDLPIQRRIELRGDNKTGTLTSVLKDNVVVNIQTQDIRKLMPVECERLQGLPDGYTAGVAKTHRYKCLGNAFHVDVLQIILSNMDPAVQVSPVV